MHIRIVDLAKLIGLDKVESFFKVGLKKHFSVLCSCQTPAHLAAAHILMAVSLDSLTDTVKKSYISFCFHYHTQWWKFQAVKFKKTGVFINFNVIPRMSKASLYVWSLRAYFQQWYKSMNIGKGFLFWWQVQLTVIKVWYVRLKLEYVHEKTISPTLSLGVFTERQAKLPSPKLGLCF